MAFIELTDTSISKKILLNTDWIKSVIPIEDKADIIVGDGYFNALNTDDIIERYRVAESYEEVRAMVQVAERRNIVTILGDK